MGVSKEFLNACRSRYINLSALVLQCALKQLLQKEYGEKFEDQLRRNIKRIQDEGAEDEFSKYINLIRDYGYDFSLENMDVSVICAYIDDFGLVDDEAPLSAIRNIREMRNRVGHEVNVAEDTTETDKAFWEDSREVFINAAKVFSLPQNVMERIDDYYNGVIAVSFEAMSPEEKLFYANEILREGRGKEAFDIVKDLADNDYGPALLTMARFYLLEEAGVEKYDTSVAEDYVKRAIKCGTPGAGDLEEEINKITRLQFDSLFAKDSDCVLQLAAMHKKNEFLPNKWKYIFAYYLKAKELGWEGFDEELRRELYDNKNISVLDYYYENGQTNKIIEYINSLDDNGAARILSRISGRMGIEIKKLYADRIIEGRVPDVHISKAIDLIRRDVAACREKVTEATLPECLELNLYTARVVEKLLDNWAELHRCNKEYYFEDGVKACRFGMEHSDKTEFTEIYEKLREFCISGKILDKGYSGREKKLGNIKYAKMVLSEDEHYALCCQLWNELGCSTINNAKRYSQPVPQRARVNSYPQFELDYENWMQNNRDCVKNAYDRYCEFGVVGTGDLPYEITNGFEIGYDELRMDCYACGEYASAYQYINAYNSMRRNYDRFIKDVEACYHGSGHYTNLYERTYKEYEKFDSVVRWEATDKIYETYQKALEYVKNEKSKDCQYWQNWFFDRTERNLEEFRGFMKAFEDKAFADSYFGDKDVSFYMDEKIKEQVDAARTLKDKFGWRSREIKDNALWFNKEEAEKTMARIAEEKAKAAKKAKIKKVLTVVGITLLALAVVGAVVFAII